MKSDDRRSRYGNRSGIALRDGDEGPIVDLNAVMQTVYQSAALDLAIDYSAQLVPALNLEERDWVRSIGPKA